jgi:GNAT superfamily N-acetyltransferase
MQRPSWQHVRVAENGIEQVSVRMATVEDAAWVAGVLGDSWGSAVMVVHGESIDATRCPALVATGADGERIGLLTYRDDARGREVVSLDGVRPRRGAGSALLHAAADGARRAGLRRIWLVTTNENTDALRFYQRRGYDLCALHRDAVTRSRLVKPTIPEHVDGIALRHEIELERLL